MAVLAGVGTGDEDTWSGRDIWVAALAECDRGEGYLGW